MSFIRADGVSYMRNFNEFMVYAKPKNSKKEVYQGVVFPRRSCYDENVIEWFGSKFGEKTGPYPTRKEAAHSLLVI